MPNAEPDNRFPLLPLWRLAVHDLRAPVRFMDYLLADLRRLLSEEALLVDPAISHAVSRLAASLVQEKTVLESLGSMIQLVSMPASAPAAVSLSSLLHAVFDRNPELVPLQEVLHMASDVSLTGERIPLELALTCILRHFLRLTGSFASSTPCQLSVEANILEKAVRVDLVLTVPSGQEGNLSPGSASLTQEPLSTAASFNLALADLALQRIGGSLEGARRGADQQCWQMQISAHPCPPGETEDNMRVKGSGSAHL